jgi:hypothetical protein
MATALNVPPTAPITTPQQMKKEEEKVDYLNLPCPIPYEEIHREALSLSLFLSVSMSLFFPFCFCRDLIFSGYQPLGLLFGDLLGCMLILS